MAITSLNTTNFSDTAKTIAEKVKEFTESKRKLEEYFKALKDGWEGEGRKQYDINYAKLTRQLSDIQDELYDMRDSLIEAEAAYIEADNGIAKELYI